MNLVATPTNPTDIETGAMVDIDSLPDEYAVLIEAQPVEGGTAVIVTHADKLCSVIVPEGDTLPVISYALTGVVSNVLEA